MNNRGGTLLIPLHQQVKESAFTHFAGASPLTHCLHSMLESSHTFDSIVVGAAEAHAAEVHSVLAAQKFNDIRLAIAEGSGDRADCLSTGLNASSADTEFVVIHDLSRPLASWTVRNRVIDRLNEGHEFVVPALVVVDSVKALDRGGSIARTVDRSRLRSSQFPRGMKSGALRRSLESWRSSESFDELQHALIEGRAITSVEGDPDGFDMSSARDRTLAEAIVSCRLEGRR